MAISPTTASTLPPLLISTAPLRPMAALWAAVNPPRLSSPSPPGSVQQRPGCAEQHLKGGGCCCFGTMAAPLHPCLCGAGRPPFLLPGHLGSDGLGPCAPSAHLCYTVCCRCLACAAPMLWLQIPPSYHLLFCQRQRHGYHTCASALALQLFSCSGCADTQMGGRRLVICTVCRPRCLDAWPPCGLQCSATQADCHRASARQLDAQCLGAAYRRLNGSPQLTSAR